MKKNLRYFQTILWLCLLFVIALNGCATTETPVPSLTSTSPPPTHTPLSPRTSSPTVTLSPTVTVSPTKTLSPTLRPTRTITPTITPTWTPLPTFSPDEAGDFVIDLLQNHVDCELPCWWGIIPDSTNRYEAQAFFEQFGSTIRRARFDPQYGSINIFLDSKSLYFNINYINRNDIVTKLYIVTSMREDRGEDGFFKIYNDPNYYQMLNHYTVDSILETYGPPGEVWIKSYNINAVGHHTHTLLYYPDIGIVMEYVSPTRWFTNADEETWVSTCPAEGFISLRVFDPDAGWSLFDILSRQDNLGLYLPIKEATDMTLQEFYDIYQNPGCDVEIHTPADLWPSVYNIWP